jgi:hypothetical protein
MTEFHSQARPSDWASLRRTTAFVAGLGALAGSGGLRVDRPYGGGPDEMLFLACGDAADSALFCQDRDGPILSLPGVFRWTRLVHWHGALLDTDTPLFVLCGTVEGQRFNLALPLHPVFAGALSGGPDDPPFRVSVGLHQHDPLDPNLFVPDHILYLGLAFPCRSAEMNSLLLASSAPPTAARPLESEHARI